MKIQSLQVSNFRCFESLTVNFHRQLTVLVADNGMGKTAILEALAAGLGVFLSQLGVPGRNPRETDFRIADDGKQPPYMRIRMETTEGIAWDRTERRDQSKSTAKQIPLGVGYKQIANHANAILNSRDNAQGNQFPLIAYYGTGRAVFDTPQRRRSFKKEFPFHDAYQGALDATPNFRRFFEYFYFLEDVERRGKEEHRDWDYRLAELEAIREAIARMMPGFSNPHSKLHPLRFMVEWRHEDRQQTLRMDQLSDGFRTTLAMVMDIAARLTGLNPIGKAALDATGVVLIDEIDLHLHPSWQQRILPDLMRTFPNIQFIVTTHSPQVLTTVNVECIRLMDSEVDEDSGQSRYRIASPSLQTKGVASPEVLARIMGTDPVPDVPEARQLSEYRALIQQGLEESPEGQNLHLALLSHFGCRHPEILECERMIRLEAFKRKLPARK